MYPTISYLIEDLFGVFIPLPIQTFGFFVAIAFLLASWTISLELKRKENQGILDVFIKNKVIGLKASNWQLISASIIGFLIGFKILEAICYYHEFVNNPQEFILSLRGNLLGGFAGAIISGYSKYQEYEKQSLPNPKTIQEKIHPYQLVGNIIMMAAISGLIGAKIFHNLENIDAFLADPLGQLLSFSGLTFYGGFICGAIAVIWYAKKYNIHYTHIADAAAPGLMLAYGVGRMGCHFSGDGDWGINNLAPKPSWMSSLPDWMWAYDYPNNVINAGIPIEGCVGSFCHRLPYPVFPTAFYEVIMGLALFAFLWSIRKRIKIPGMLFGVYLILNGLERFSIEKIRINTNYTLFGMEITQAEIISSCLIVLGLSIVLYLRKKSVLSQKE